MYYVYLLVSPGGESYIGVTADLQERFRSHNAQENRSAKHSVWHLAYYEAYAAKEDACRRERRLKDDGRARRQLMQRTDQSRTFVW